MLQGCPQSLPPLRWVAASPSPAPVAHGARTPLLTHLRGRLVSVSARAASLCVSKHSCLFVWPLPAAVVRVAVVVFSHATNSNSGRFYSGIV